jgi:hypothetical protein
MRRIVVSLFLVVSAVSCGGSPGGPKTIPRAGHCRVRADSVEKQGHPPAIGSATATSEITLQTCAQNISAGMFDLPCACMDYQERYPDPPPATPDMSLDPSYTTGADPGLTGVFDEQFTRNINGFVRGCTGAVGEEGSVQFAWPDCATVGQVSGTVYAQPFFTPGEVGSGGTGGNTANPCPGYDDDVMFEICPDPTGMSVRMPDNTWIEKDLRAGGNFYGRGGDGLPAQQPVGRVRIAVQGCEYFKGDYQIVDPPNGGPIQTRGYSARPLPGDIVTAAGDWVVNTWQESESGQNNWIELREARIIATARKALVPADGSLSYIFVSTTFQANTNQADLMEVSAKVPSPGAGWKLSSCAIETKLPDSRFVGTVLPNGQPINTMPCDPYPDQHVSVEANEADGTCRIVVDKVNLNLADVNRDFRDGNKCQNSCDDLDFHQGQISKPGGGTSFDSCRRVGWLGIIRAVWTPTTAAAPPIPPPNEDGSAPGDLWMCNNCACGDPGSSSPFSLPVMGCAPQGLNPTSAADQRAACDAACGDFVCTGAQSCLVGACRRPATETIASARLVGRNACVPGLKPDRYRPTSATRYHVTLTPFNPATSQGSAATITVGDQTRSGIPVNGVLALDLSESLDVHDGLTKKILSIADLEVTPADFTLAGRAASSNKIFAAQRLFASFDGATSFQVAPLTAVLGVRGLLDGSEVGTNQENPTAAIGTFDPVTRTFALDFQGQDVDAGTSRTLSVHLVGQVDNLPPTAVITGAPATLECGTPLTLSGQSSSDPDAGDAITRFQWMVNGTGGGTANRLDVASRKLGRNDFDLRVYDHAMAADHATAQINIVDTRAPQFTFVPPNMTVRACAGLNIGTATATDACGAVTVTNNAPAHFTFGQTTVTWTARDAAGNTRTATQIITVELGDDASCCPAGSHVVVGTPNNDVLVGTAGVDCILGLGGQDQISGRGGDDFLSGGDGDDVINGEDGNDIIFGGSGQDQITGGNGNDTINGGDGDDTCHGSAGNDVIHGNQGQDHLFGDDAADSLFGDDGDDTLDGGPGNDALNGGGIHDVCIGGTGTNTFTLCETRR